MAAISGSTNSHLWTFKIEVTEKNISVVDNTSDVVVSAYIGRSENTNQSYMTGAVISGSFNVGSESKPLNYATGSGKTVYVKPGQWLKLDEKTFTVLHNSDGSKTVNVSASFTNNVSPASGSANGSVTLTNIARASNISMSGGNIGSEATITITPTDPSYFYTLKYSFYGESGICADSNGNSADRIDNTSFKWLIPLSLADEISDTTYGTGSLTCITYNSDRETIVGEKTISIRLEFLKQPTISFGKDRLIITNTNEGVAGWGICLAGHSGINVQATATAYNGATIKSCSVSIGGHGTFTSDVTDNVATYNISYFSSILTSTGTKNVKISVRDSRGITSGFVDVGTVEVYKYFDPNIKTFTVGRKDDNQSLVSVKCNWEIASIVKSGEYKELNSSKGVIHWKEGKNGTYKPVEKDGSIITVENGKETELPLTFDATKSYYFKLIVTDWIGQTDSREAFISTREVLMDFRAGGKGLAIGKISESNSLEVALQSKFYNKICIHDRIYGKLTDDNESDILHVSDSNNVVLGYGNYANKTGNAHIYGNDIRLYSASAGNSNNYFIPYYRVGDSENIDIDTAGYLTASGTYIYFTIPLCKPVIGNPTITIECTSGFILRQNGYTHGSNGAADPPVYVKSKNITATYTTVGLRVVAEFSDTTNAMNNAPIGIHFSGKITFS